MTSFHLDIFKSQVTFALDWRSKIALATFELAQRHRTASKICVSAARVASEEFNLYLLFNIVTTEIGSADLDLVPFYNMVLTRVSDLRLVHWYVLIRGSILKYDEKVLSRVL